MNKTGWILLLVGIATVAALLCPLYAGAVTGTADVTINDPLPLFCGSGGVPIGGMAYAAVGEQFNNLKVYFAVAGQPLTTVVASQTINDSTWHSWSTHVAVTQGTAYTIWATMKDAAGNLGTSMLITKTVAKCVGTDLANLLDDLSLRLHNAVAP
jgi:hypothetical protein